jgi:hypothetical protein
MLAPQPLSVQTAGGLSPSPAYPLSPAPAGLSFDTRKGNPMNWPLVRICLFIAAIADSLSLGRLSVEFSGSGSDWTLRILSVVALIGVVIGLAAGDLVRQKPN